MRDTEKQPSCKVVARRKGNYGMPSPNYALYENGELWLTGKHAFRAGYVMNADNIDYAIDVFEDEMRIGDYELAREFGS